jgi:hypothetical protein
MTVTELERLLFPTAIVIELERVQATDLIPTLIDEMYPVLMVAIHLQTLIRQAQHREGL